jgi:hypothetical protein
MEINKSDKIEELKRQAKIVKGGKSFNVLGKSYREGYDIVQRDNGKYYLSVMNGPFEIFTGPDAETIEDAEKIGLEQLKKDNPRLARNIGVLETLITEARTIQSLADEYQQNYDELYTDSFNTFCQKKGLDKTTKLMLAQEILNRLEREVGSDNASDALDKHNESSIKEEVMPKATKADLAAAEERTKTAMSLLRKIHKAKNIDELNDIMNTIEKDATTGKIDDKQEQRLKDSWARRKDVLDKAPADPGVDPTADEEKAVAAEIEEQKTAAEKEVETEPEGELVGAVEGKQPKNPSSDKEGDMIKNLLEKHGKKVVEGKVRKYNVTFTVTMESDCPPDVTPQKMMDNLTEDGSEVGFTIENVEISQLKESTVEKKDEKVKEATNVQVNSDNAEDVNVNVSNGNKEVQVASVDGGVQVTTVDKAPEVPVAPAVPAEAPAEAPATEPAPEETPAPEAPVDETPGDEDDEEEDEEAPVESMHTKEESAAIEESIMKQFRTING